LQKKKKKTSPSREKRFKEAREKRFKEALILTE
jgi:hypothetical protein